MSGLLVYRKRRRASGTRRAPWINVDAPLLSLNTVCLYYTMFPLEFPLRDEGRILTACSRRHSDQDARPLPR
jgi:hypothetical protein